MAHAPRHTDHVRDIRQQGLDTDGRRVRPFLPARKPRLHEKERKHQEEQRDEPARAGTQSAEPPNRGGGHAPHAPREARRVAEEVVEHDGPDDAAHRGTCSSNTIVNDLFSFFFFFVKRHC